MINVEDDTGPADALDLPRGSKIAVSVAAPGDHGWIASTFTTSLRHAPPWCWGPTAQYEEAFRRVLRAPDSTVLVATPTGHEELLGWLVESRGALIAAYTRHVVRRRGVLKCLLVSCEARTGGWSRGQSGIACAFWSRAFARMAENGAPLRFDIAALERIMVPLTSRGKATA